MLLAGDVGGTKTDLAVYASRDTLRTPLLERTLPSAKYPSLEALVLEFLTQNSLTIDRACFGVPGPVVDGKAKITNLPWLLNEKNLQKSLPISSIHLMNDLDAMAHAIPFLRASDLYTLNAGKPDIQGTLAVIAPGTGLGEAFLTWNGTKYVTHPSEGGHTDFAPTNLPELELLRFLLKRFAHVSYEHVCSGLGLPNIYAYLKESTAAQEPLWLKEQLALASDPTPIIVKAALDDEAPNTLCVATLKTFVSILGAEAGNLALKVLATGGLYIGGGIPPRILPFLKDENFMNAFRHKGRLSSLLTNVPIHVVIQPKLALMGAGYRGFEVL